MNTIRSAWRLDHRNPATVFQTAYITDRRSSERTQKSVKVRIRGNAIVGEVYDRKRPSTELKNVILFNKVQVPHYNYVGDSILGRPHGGPDPHHIQCQIRQKAVVVVKAGDEKDQRQVLKNSDPCSGQSRKSAAAAY